MLETTQETTPKDVVRALCGYGCRTDEFIEDVIDELRKTHRTEQAGVIRSFQNIMKHYSSFSSDGRNEAAVDLCKEVTKIKIGIPFI
jgi:hypothetical protein